MLIAGLPTLTLIFKYKFKFIFTFLSIDFNINPYTMVFKVNHTDYTPKVILGKRISKLWVYTAISCFTNILFLYIHTAIFMIPRYLN